MNEISTDVIEKRKSSKQKEDSESDSIHYYIDILLNARDDEGHGLSHKEMLDEVNTFMFAGHDTTGSALPFCLYCMAKYTTHQDKCRQEINDIIGDKDDITGDDLAKLTYITMCIKETLRLYGPVLFIQRQLSEDTTLPDGKVIPKGCTSGIVMEAIHHNPDIWENPDEFDPLRFSPENAKKRHSHAFVAFSAGPRNCLGQNFAMSEMKLMLAITLRKLRLRLDENKPMEMTAPALRGTKTGMWIKMEII